LIAARIRICRLFPSFAVPAVLFLSGAGIGFAQSSPVADLPDAPQASATGSGDASGRHDAGGQSQTTSPQSSSGSQSSAQQPGADQSQREKGAEEVKEQEKQRVEGIVPTFNVTYRQDAVPLTPGQKMNLSLHSSLDPFTVASAFITAGYHEADNDLKGFDWGPEGFFERTGVAYLDTFDSTILSTGVFPIIFRQDPRYFRLGYGSPGHRILYSLSTNFIARNDYGKRGWGPNYGNVLGNFAAGEISNFYYPKGNSSVSLAATNTVVQIAEGAGGSLFNEFWPDISRRFFHKDPTHGLDAQLAAQAREQQAQKQEQKQLKNSTPPPQSADPPQSPNPQ
jgi:hypothetical protein